MSNAAKGAGIARRNFVQLAGAIGAAGVASLAGPQAAAAASETQADVTPQPILPPSPEMNTSDILVETLIAWGATHVFGIVGDGINPIIEALRKRQDRIRFIGVRHEEAAAFMASGFAKHTGRLGVCLGTTGPGAIHLMNGLYDAAVRRRAGRRDHRPDLSRSDRHPLSAGRRHHTLMQDVALYNVEVTGPGHAIFVANLACRAALGERGVAHLTIAKDVQTMKLAADKPSMENHGARTSTSWSPPRGRAARRPAAGRRRRSSMRARASRSLRARARLPRATKSDELADRSARRSPRLCWATPCCPTIRRFTTGGIGHLGTAPSSLGDAKLRHGADPRLDHALDEYYPNPGRRAACRSISKPDRIGLRYPVEVGLVGDVKATLRGLLPLLRRKTDAASSTKRRAA